MDGWMKKMIFFCGWVSGWQYSSVDSFLLTSYLCVFVFSFGLFGRGLLYLIDLIERLAPIFRN